MKPKVVLGIAQVHHQILVQANFVIPTLRLTLKVMVNMFRVTHGQSPRAIYFVFGSNQKTQFSKAPLNDIKRRLELNLG